MHKLMTKFFVCVIAAAWPIAALAQVQAPSTAPVAALPSVDDILAKFEKALGGKEALEKQSSRYSKGTFTLGEMGSPGSTEIYQKAPDKMLTVTDTGQFGIFRSGVDGANAWVDTPQGVQDLTGAAAAASKRGALFYGELHMKESYPKMVVKSKDKFDGKDVYVVEATPTEGSPELLSFDADSGLMVRSQTQMEGPQGTVDVDTRLSDYRDVDGVKIPFKFEQQRSDFSFVIQFTEVKHNVPIDDAKFEKPKS